MFTSKPNFFCTNGKIVVEAACNSTDDKPTDGIANGSLCLEVDTGKIFAFDEQGQVWTEIA